MTEIPRGGTRFEPYIRLMPGQRYRVQVPQFAQATFDGVAEAREYRDKTLAEKQRKSGAQQRKTAAQQRRAAVEERKRSQQSRQGGPRRRRTGSPKFSQKATEWLAHRWHLAERGDLKRSTVNHNSTVLHTYVLPRLGHLTLDEIRISTIEDFRVELDLNGAARSVGGVGAGCVRHCMIVVGQVFTYCIRREEWVGVNPVTAATKPKKRTERITNPASGEVGKAKFLSLEEADTLVEYLEKTDHHLLNVVRFNLYMGLRPGELFPLQWDMVDLDMGRVHVRRFLDESAPGRRDIISEYGKTSMSFRTVPFPDSLGVILKEHRSRQDPGEDLVFPSPRSRGSRMYLSNSMNAQLRRACEAAGVPRITPYGLRHTNATFMLIRNVNPKVAAERLGHTSTQMFLDTYSHVNPRLHDEGALALEGIV